MGLMAGGKLRNFGAPGFEGTYGYSFQCPGCKMVHGIYVQGPVKWEFNGNTVAPTFQPSVLVTGHHWVPPVTPENIKEWKLAPWEQKKVERRCHSYITDGRIQFLGDCTHELAGQTVDIPQWESE